MWHAAEITLLVDQMRLSEHSRGMCLSTGPELFKAVSVGGFLGGGLMKPKNA